MGHELALKLRMLFSPSYGSTRDELFWQNVDKNLNKNSDANLFKKGVRIFLAEKIIDWAEIWANCGPMQRAMIRLNKLEKPHSSVIIHQSYWSNEESDSQFTITENVIRKLYTAYMSFNGVKNPKLLLITPKYYLPVHKLQIIFTIRVVHMWDYQMIPTDSPISHRL